MVSLKHEAKKVRRYSSWKSHPHRSISFHRLPTASSSLDSHIQLGIDQNVFKDTALVLKWVYAVIDELRPSSPWLCLVQSVNECSGLRTTWSCLHSPPRPSPLAEGSALFSVRVFRKPAALLSAAFSDSVIP